MIEIVIFSLAVIAIIVVMVGLVGRLGDLDDESVMREMADKV